MYKLIRYKSSSLFLYISHVKYINNSLKNKSLFLPILLGKNEGEKKGEVVLI